MSELTPEARAILMNGASAGTRSAEDRARIREALRAKMALLPPVAPPPSVAGPAGGFFARRGLFARVGLAGVVLVAAAAFPALRYARRATTATPAPTSLESVARTSAVSSASAAVSVEAPPSVLVPVPVVASAAVVPAVASGIAASAPPVASPVASPVAAVVRARVARENPRVPAVSTPTSTLGAELALLRGAQGAMRSGDHARALALLAEHSTRYPRGVLTEERSAERIIVLCASGRHAEARAELARFERAHPQSPQLARARSASCGAPP